jgi:CRISPR type I-E-associated protein CasB/Cse2
MPLDHPEWRDVVGKIAWRIGREDYPSGSLAELRRLRPDAPDGAAFWRLVVEYADRLADDRQAVELRALAAVVHGMAIMHPLHVSKGERRSLGRAMAECRIKDIRLLRLLRLGAEELPEELRRLARLMASKGETGRFDWSDAVFLLLTADDPQGEQVRRRIARDYYRAEYQQQQSGEVAA